MSASAFRAWSRKTAAKLRQQSFMLFGAPFLVAMAGGSYALSYLTQIRYDYHDKRHKAQVKEEKLLLDTKRKRYTVQEEYWRLTHNKDVDDWDFVRVPRPKYLEDT
ncbi:hypothetical protein HK102_001704 [Quaeritorhiza haematococci]|nr:hypothetical protein HK102_001704 [Quaeritorhiza haematococci]